MNSFNFSFEMTWNIWNYCSSAWLHYIHQSLFMQMIASCGTPFQVLLIRPNASGKFGRVSLLLPEFCLFFVINNSEKNRDSSAKSPLWWFEISCERLDFASLAVLWCQLNIFTIWYQIIFIFGRFAISILCIFNFMLFICWVQYLERHTEYLATLSLRLELTSHFNKSWLLYSQNLMQFHNFCSIKPFDSACLWHINVISSITLLTARKLIDWKNKFTENKTI